VLEAEVSPMAQRELRTPNASRDRRVLADDALGREVSFTVEETLVSVRSILKNFCLATRLECKSPACAIGEVSA
jgi:hypothetical protein